MRTVRTVTFVCVVSILALPILAGAQTQSVITGTVTDATGAVLPGVTVEARSPVLIEGVRTVTTDGEGLYRIVDLRPGTYQVSFELPGFSRVVREGITLEANFTATINTQMRVGGVEETLTVTGAAPVVDVQTAVRRDVITSEQVESLPTGRMYSSIGATLPAVNLSGTTRSIDVGGSNAMQQSSTSAYGSTTQSFEIDGLKVDSSLSTGLINLYLNVDDYEQFVFSVNGGNAEQRAGGVLIQAIPKSGGNKLAGRAFALGSNSALSAINASPEQLAAGLRIPTELVRAYDFQFALGGPIKRDKLWFFNANRAWANDTTVALVHDGKDTAHKPGEPVVDKNLLQSYSLRLTWQATGRDRLTAMYNRLPKWREYFRIENLQWRPEAATSYRTPNSYIAQAKWTGTISNRLLGEAGLAMNQLVMNSQPHEGYRDHTQFPPYGDIQHFDAVLNQSSNAVETFSNHPMTRHDYAASLSYVTGRHAFKVGTQIMDAYFEPRFTVPADLIQVYRNGVPFAVDAIASCGVGCRHVSHADAFEVGLYVQDTWTFKRVTLNPGVRWDRFKGSLPPQSNPAGRFVPATSFPAIDNLPLWKDVSSRFGASMDVFGDGRLALRANLGRYPQQQATGFPAKYNPARCCQIFSVNVKDRRNWTDLNGDNIAQNNEIGPSNNPAFGLANNFNPDPNLEREYDLLYNVGGDYALRSGLAVSVAYNRRDSRNQPWADNLTNSPEDYEMFTLPDPRGTGQPLEVYQVRPSRVGPLRQLDRNSTNTRVYSGFDVMTRGRFANGMSFTAGTSTGRIIENNCQFENPNYTSTSLPGIRFCNTGDYDIPLLTTFKASGIVPLPWYGFQLSGVFQSVPGSERITTYVVTRAQLPRLTTASSVTVRLNEPGSQYMPRINNFDLSLAKTIRLGEKRLKPVVEMFNVFNNNVELSIRDSFPLLGQPLVIMPGRLVRFQVQYEW